MIQMLQGKYLQSESIFLKGNDLFFLQLEKSHARNGDLCNDLSVLVLFTKARVWDVKRLMCWHLLQIK